MAPRPTATPIRVTVALPSALDTLDPVRTDRPDARSVLQHLYDPLLRRDRSNNFVPMLAARWEPASSTLWRLAIREYMHFHDGSVVTAADVVASLRRLQARMDPAGAWRVEGWKDLRAAGPNTVEIETDQPDVLLPSKLADVAYVMPRRLAESPDDVALNTSPLGSGPYRLAAWSPGQPIELQAHAAYWRGAPRVDRVVFRPTPNLATRVDALLSGTVDIAPGLDSPQAQRILASTGHALSRPQSNRAYYIGVRQDRGPLPSHPRVRQALQVGVNRSVLVEHVFGVDATALASPLSRLHVGHTADLRLPDNSPSEALLLLRGALQGPSATLPFDVRSSDRDLGSAIVSSLNQFFPTAGLTIEPRYHDDAEFDRRLAGGDVADLFLDSVDVTLMDGTRVYERAFRTGSPHNYTAYSDPDTDRLLQQATTTFDAADRAPIIAQVSHRLRETLPWIVLLSPILLSARTNRLAWQARSDELITTYDDVTPLA